MDSETDLKTPRKPNPRQTINPLLAVFFVHLFPIFHRTYRKGFTKEDLFAPLDEHKACTLGDKLEELWLNEVKLHKKTPLHRALLKQFGVYLTIIGLIKVSGEILYLTVVSQSVGELLNYFGEGPSTITTRDAYMYATLIICTLALCNITAHSCFMAMTHLGMKMRIACTSLIYRKSLRLSQFSMAQTTIGHILNLLSNDVSKFDAGTILFHYIWTSPVQAVIGTYLLYRKIGSSAFVGMAFLLAFIPLQVFLAKQNAKIRLKTAGRTDKRVHLMEEILSGIQAIKMYTWEKPFAKLVSASRRLEIKAIRMRYYLQTVVFSLDMFITRSCIFISIVGFTYSGNSISANTAYTVSAIYSILRSLITMHFFYSVLSLGEILVTIGRLQDFLCLEELTSSPDVPQILADCNGDQVHDKVHLLPTKRTDLFKASENSSIILKSVSAKWLKESEKPTISDINLIIQSRQLVAVIGPVGSGKSSLINVILKELPISEGYLETYGTISYASQKSWLFSASLRQNILFGLPYEEDRYWTVIKVCSLESDLEMLPNGDQTLVGEKGNALSGGQKARVNLARCIYKRADIYLLDDPLSAVDIKVAKTLFDDCIKNFLHDKICILVTHQLQYLRDVDKVIIVKEGRIVGNGTCNELENSSVDFAKLLVKSSATSEDDCDIKVDEVKNHVNLHSKHVKSFQKAGESNKEVLQTGSVTFSTYIAYFRSGGNCFILLLVGLLFFAAQGTANAGDYLVSKWVNIEQENLNNNGTIAGRIFGIDTYGRKSIIYLYSGITFATIALAFIHSFCFFMFVMNASINTHDIIFGKISNATMRFFNSNPVGRILNRFSKDIGVIDELLPTISIDFFHIVLVLCGALAVTSIVNGWLMFPILILMFISYPLRKVYIATSRTVKRLEGITRSSMFNHITATMDGLSTIRAFEAQKVLIQEFDCHQDLQSAAWYLYISSSRGFGLWVDIIYVTFLGSVVMSLLSINKELYHGGDIGLILTQYLTLVGLLQWGIRQWTELENNMTSVERVLEYTKVETEPVRNEIANLPKSWPEMGKIDISNVSLTYNPNEAPVLKNLNFSIFPAEKIGVVGRTGAGKSSTITALFQLYPVEGDITIDGVSTSKVPLDTLRSKMSIIPQAPVLFTGTVRKNLDPFEEFNDELMWSALEDVKLKSAVLDMSGGLSASVQEGGTNFSVGQRQLICLARAILRRNKILVLDEATANVDPQTDALIQNTVRTNFSDCTVITIAHRLETVMDSDKILVMDAGQVVEFDRPYSLLQQEGSFLYSMVEATGKTTAKSLKSAAEQYFLKTKE